MIPPTRVFSNAMASSFLDPDVVLAYSDSEAIGPEGESLAKSYRFYTDTLDETKWQCGYVESGPTEIATALAVKNTIPNVSAAIFRREALRSAVEAIQDFRYCGDWRAYVECLRQGKIAFFPQPLNRHRQDPGSVTQKGERATLAVREALAIKRAIFSDFAVTDRVFWLSLAQTVFEYELRSSSLAGGRPAFADNEDLAGPINNMSGIIAKRGALCATRRNEAADYLRRLAEEQPSLDKAARNMIIARAMAALKRFAASYN